MEIKRQEETGSKRSVWVQRNTKETKITMSLDIDGRGKASLDTGIGFFDHMLDGFARHGFFDLDVAVQGDLEVDSHHTIEDTGIVLGNAIKEAVGDKAGIRRFGSVVLPMDETLVLCAVDLSGRPYLNFDASFTTPKLGDMDTEMAREFFHAVSYGAGINLHIKVLDGTNNHHIMEAVFKAFAKALDEATQIDARIQGVLSTKGSL
ncbi:MAG: imidazoleglycerol-phosphate dehydratase HisB [Clostridiales bacterium]|nr:imidazoleglycerol-phosphate dehydratase HisB [Clostridiales bacterium]